MGFFVYVLRSESTGKTYVGQTSDLERRVAQHNDPDFTLTLYTKRNKGPWRLIHSEAYPSRKEAMGREKYLKSGQRREWLRASILSEDAGGRSCACGASQAVDPPKADSSPVRSRRFAVGESQILQGRTFSCGLFSCFWGHDSNPAFGGPMPLSCG